MQNVFQEVEYNRVSIILNNGWGEIFPFFLFFFEGCWYNWDYNVQCKKNLEMEIIRMAIIYLLQKGFKVSNLIIYRMKYI